MKKTQGWRKLVNLTKTSAGSPSSSLPSLLPFSTPFLSFRLSLSQAFFQLSVFSPKLSSSFFFFRCRLPLSFSLLLFLATSPPSSLFFGLSTLSRHLFSILLLFPVSLSLNFFLLSSFFSLPAPSLLLSSIFSWQPSFFRCQLHLSQPSSSLPHSRPPSLSQLLFCYQPSQTLLSISLTLPIPPNLPFLCFLMISLLLMPFTFIAKWSMNLVPIYCESFFPVDRFETEKLICFYDSEVIEACSSYGWLLKKDK